MFDVFVVKYVVFEALSVIFVVFYHQFTRFCFRLCPFIRNILVSVLIFCLGFYHFWLDHGLVNFLVPFFGPIFLGDLVPRVLVQFFLAQWLYPFLGHSSVLPQVPMDR